MAKAKTTDGMVKVKFLISMAGVGFSYTINEIVEVESDFASQLINAGYAEKVE